jgi:hypothetical protein
LPNRLLNAFRVFAFLAQKNPLANFVGQKREVPVNEQGLAMFWNLKLVCPELLLTEKQTYKLNFQMPNDAGQARTKAEQRTAADCTIVKPKYCQTQCYVPSFCFFHPLHSGG